MSKIHKSFLILGLFASARLATAFPNCTDAEVIRRVCQRNFSKTGASCDDKSYDRLDDTGYAKMTSDVADTYKFALKKSGHIVSTSSYQKFHEAFDTVFKAYIKLANNLKNPEKEEFLTRLKAMKIPSLESLNDSVIGAAIVGVNSGYHSDGKFTFAPVILNYPAISIITLEVMIAHEMGHALGPKEYNPYVGNEKLFLDHLSTDVRNCFTKSYSLSEKENGNIVGEFFADWMASQVAADVIESSGTPSFTRERALNWSYGLCKKEFQEAGPITKALEKQISNTSQDDDHPQNIKRILMLVSDPKMLNLMGCGDKVVRTQKISSSTSCFLSELK